MALMYTNGFCSEKIDQVISELEATITELQKHHSEMDTENNYRKKDIDSCVSECELAISNLQTYLEDSKSLLMYENEEEI